MNVIKLGRLELWYNSFFRISISIPLLLAIVLGTKIPWLYALVYIAIVLMNYFLTSIINYYSDVEEDALKYKLGQKWNRIMDPENPMVCIDEITERRYILRRSFIIYIVFSVILATIIIYMVSRPYILLFHCFVLFTVAVVYSIGPRLKESPFGVFIASMLYWYPVFMIFTHIGVLTPETWLYTSVILILGLGESIKHTLDHYAIDRAAGKRTFVSIFGMKSSKVAIYIIFLLVYVLLIAFSWMLHVWPLAVMALLCACGYVLMKLKLWPGFFFVFYIYLLVIIYMNNRFTESAIIATLCGIPIFLTTTKLKEYMWREVTAPYYSLFNWAYHRIMGTIHAIKHSILKK